jgi:hypothetical protein
VGTIYNPGSWVFSLRRIGPARYRSAVGALSTACRRLEARGLVRCVRGELGRWAGVETTDRGREWLAANTGDKTAGC